MGIFLDVRICAHDGSVKCLNIIFGLKRAERNLCGLGKSGYTTLLNCHNHTFMDISSPRIHSEFQTAFTELVVACWFLKRKGEKVKGRIRKGIRKLQ